MRFIITSIQVVNILDGRTFCHSTKYTVHSNPSNRRLVAAEGQQLARDGFMVSQVLIDCTHRAVVDATALLGAHEF
jgi:hypothetical protein